MSDTISQSVTGQNQPTPTREERDEAVSSGAGRKAVEKEKAPREHKCDDKKNAGLKPPIGLEYETRIKAPVGLECETKGDEEAAHR